MDPPATTGWPRVLNILCAYCAAGGWRAEFRHGRLNLCAESGMRDQPAHDNVAEAVVIAWLAARTLDITYACIVRALRERMPQTLLQSVASGWQGCAAYAGGVASALLGVSTHYGILLVMVSAFALVRLCFSRLRKQAWLVGPVYGLGLYAIMYGIGRRLGREPFQWAYR